jgi:hypothetical protein
MCLERCVIYRAKKITIFFNHIKKNKYHKSLFFNAFYIYLKRI